MILAPFIGKAALRSPAEKMMSSKTVTAADEPIISRDFTTALGEFLPKLSSTFN